MRLIDPSLEYTPYLELHSNVVRNLIPIAHDWPNRTPIQLYYRDLERVFQGIHVGVTIEIVGHGVAGSFYHNLRDGMRGIVRVIKYNTAFRNFPGLFLDRAVTSENFSESLRGLGSIIDFIGVEVLDDDYEAGHSLVYQNSPRATVPTKGQWVPLSDLRLVNAASVNIGQGIDPLSPPSSPPVKQGAYNLLESGYAFIGLDPARRGEAPVSCYALELESGKCVTKRGKQYNLENFATNIALHSSLIRTPEAIPQICQLKIKRSDESGKVFGLKNIKKQWVGKVLKQGRWKLSLKYISRRDNALYDSILVYDKEGDRNLRFLLSDCHICIPNEKSFLLKKDRVLKNGNTAKCIKPKGLNLSHGQKVVVKNILSNNLICVADENGVKHVGKSRQFIKV